MSFVFYWSYDCDCGEDIFSGLNLILLDEHNGRPVVPITMCEQVRLDCDHCGRSHFTGELDVFTQEIDVKVEVVDDPDDDLAELEDDKPDASDDETALT